MVMSKLILIDGHAILHRAYHAMPPFTTKRGEPIGAVHGFISMFLRVIQDLKPTHIAVAFDRKEPTFRHEEFKEYQAHRPEMDEDLEPQFDKAKDVISAFGIPIYDKAGFEADDVIGTLVKQAEKDVEEVVIITGDKDILQLIDKKIKVYLPIRGLTKAQLVDQIGVKEKMGVTPKQIIDYKALVGDASDNYKGVPGIGPKTAESLLGEYKTFKNIYKNLAKISDPTAKKLKEGKKSGEMSLKLAKIVTDVDVKFDSKDAAVWSINNPKVIKLFQEFGFRTLTERVKKVGEQIEKERQLKLV